MRSPARPVIAAGLILLVLAGGLGYALYLSSTREVPQAGGRVVEALVVDGPLSLLPPFAADTQNGRDLSSLLYRGLTRPGPDGRPRPDLSDGWQADAQAKVWTFHIRSGVRWSDGRPLTSADALFTLTLLQGDQLSGTPEGQSWAGITAVAPDPSTVVYTLPAPSAPFVSQTSIGLVPEHALSGRPAEALRGVVDAPTSGPFTVAGVNGDRLRLDRNPQARPRPWLDGIDFRLYSSESQAVNALTGGDVDILADLSPAAAASLRNRPNRSLLHAGSFAYAEMLMNQSQGGALADIQVRRAVAALVDRPAIISGELAGLARVDDSPIPPTISWAAATQASTAFDPAGAARILDQDGWTRPASGQPRQKGGQALSLHLATPDAAPYPAIAAHIARNLGAGGLAIKVEAYPQDQLLSNVLSGHHFDLALTPIDNGPDPDIYIFWHSATPGTPSYNFSGMARDVFLDKDLEDGRFSADQRTRADAYTDAQRILRANLPAVFLYCPDVVIGINQRLRGVTLPAAMDPAGRYDSVAAWYVQTQRVRR